MGAGLCCFLETRGDLIARSLMLLILDVAYKARWNVSAHPFSEALLPRPAIVTTKPRWWIKKIKIKKSHVYDRNHDKLLLHMWRSSSNYIIPSCICWGLNIVVELRSKWSSNHFTRTVQTSHWNGSYHLGRPCRRPSWTILRIQQYDFLSVVLKTGFKLQDLLLMPLLTIPYIFCHLVSKTLPAERERKKEEKKVLVFLSAQAANTWALFHPANKSSCSDFGYQGNREAE